MSDIVIEVRDLTKRYGSTTAVDGVSFTVGRGEIFGLLGPNGAGKTTTLLMIIGLTDITSGSVSILGHKSRCRSNVALDICPTQSASTTI